jgi:hypothetical protein
MITPEYQQQLVKLHATQKWGNAGWRALPQLLSLIVQHKVKHPTVLDFGAGERTLENVAKWALPHVQVTSYDPGVPGIDMLPTLAYDFTVCTDVMEHIEEQHVEATLDYLRASAQYAVYFVIACNKAKTVLPDGRNAHLTIKPPQWWHNQLAKRWKELERTEDKNYGVIARA